MRLLAVWFVRFHVDGYVEYRGHLHQNAPPYGSTQFMRLMQSEARIGLDVQVDIVAL